MSLKNKHELIERAGKVAVLMGGNSAEREVSLRGGQAVLDSLLKSGVEAIGIDAGTNLASQLISEQPTRVFNMLHGRGGEDGQVQGLLQSLGINYTGSSILSSALSIDKLKTKMIWRQSGLPTADFEIIHAQSNWQEIIDKFDTVVVKPVNEGSSIGMSIAKTAQALETAYGVASKFDSCVLAEQYIDGSEFTVTILKNRTLPAIELKTDHEFYDYDAKYVAADTQYICPAPLSNEKLEELNRICLAAFNAVGCEGWGRVDVMQNSAGEFFLLEVNTVPGMTDHSLVPLAARQAGLEFEDLLLEILFAKETLSDTDD